MLAESLFMVIMLYTVINSKNIKQWPYRSCTHWKIATLTASVWNHGSLLDTKQQARITADVEVPLN